jgi:hypothetical protein
VARKLASLSSSLAFASPFESEYSSVRNELLFQPQLWPMENWSGELEKQINDDPVAEKHEMVKYADIVERGSRYGCIGATGTGVAPDSCDAVDGGN